MGVATRAPDTSLERPPARQFGNCRGGAFLGLVQPPQSAPGLPPCSWDLGACAEPLRASCAARGRRRGALVSNDQLQVSNWKLKSMRAGPACRPGRCPDPPPTHTSLES